MARQRVSYEYVFIMCFILMISIVREEVEEEEEAGGTEGLTLGVISTKIGLIGTREGVAIGMNGTEEEGGGPIDGECPSNHVK